MKFDDAKFVRVLELRLVDGIVDLGRAARDNMPADKRYRFYQHVEFVLADGEVASDTLTTMKRVDLERYVESLQRDIGTASLSIAFVEDDNGEPTYLLQVVH